MKLSTLLVAVAATAISADNAAIGEDAYFDTSSLLDKYDKTESRPKRANVAATPIFTNVKKTGIKVKRFVVETTNGTSSSIQAVTQPQDALGLYTDYPDQELFADNVNYDNSSIYEETYQAFSEDTPFAPDSIEFPHEDAIAADITAYSLIQPPAVTAYANSPDVATFYAIGDVPYNNRQAVRLASQMSTLPTDAEFVVHVGDIRYAGSGAQCTLAEYEAVAAILKLSPVPVFIIPGDNEWNDCPNRDKAWEYWMQTFGNFENNWSHSFAVERHGSYPENFGFTHKGTLFLGLNIVGGYVHDASEWEERLKRNNRWARRMMRTYNMPTVIFGHADPTRDHLHFFGKLRQYMRIRARKNVPVQVMYINGDAHSWAYDEGYLSQPGLSRITLSGGTTDPPLQVHCDATSSSPFSFNR